MWGPLSVVICRMKESGLEGKRRLGSAAFTPFLCWESAPPTPAGNLRAWSAASGRFLSRAPDGLFRFRKVSRDSGPAGRLLVFWGSSGFRRKEGLLTGWALRGRGCSHRRDRSRRSRGHCAGSQFAATTAGGGCLFPSPELRILCAAGGLAGPASS